MAWTSLPMQPCKSFQSHFWRSIVPCCPYINSSMVMAGEYAENMSVEEFSQLRLSMFLARSTFPFLEQSWKWGKFCNDGFRCKLTFKVYYVHTMIFNYHQKFTKIYYFDYKNWCKTKNILSTAKFVHYLCLNPMKKKSLLCRLSLSRLLLSRLPVPHRCCNIRMAAVLPSCMSVQYAAQSWIQAALYTALSLVHAAL